MCVCVCVYVCVCVVYWPHKYVFYLLLYVSGVVNVCVFVTINVCFSGYMLLSLAAYYEKRSRDRERERREKGNRHRNRICVECIQ